MVVMPNLKPVEILLIVLVVLLLFGAKRLPDLARSVGKSLKILKTEVKDLDEGRTAEAAERTPAAAKLPQTFAAGPVDLALPVDGLDRTHA